LALKVSDRSLSPSATSQFSRDGDQVSLPTGSKNIEYDNAL
jgi:hypothetical protein